MKKKKRQADQYVISNFPSTKNAKSFTELYIEGMPSVYLLLHRVVFNAFIQLNSAKNYVNFSKEM